MLVSKGKEVGPFVVDRELGSGAMGSVYLAHFKDKDDQRVALKFVGAGVATNPKAYERFQREAEILKQLKHPNIVRLIGVGKHQKLPYYAMEYVEGRTLSHELERRGRLPWEQVVALGQQVCAALQHAHEQGIIHRDVKPSNLMVLADGTLKLTDFGIAKDLDVTQLTSANCTVGTASYMSPEQCKGERNLTHKSDLYSLGVVLYELLTGRKPFEAESAMDMFLMHVQGQFERPSRKVMDIPPWLDTLICQLLEKKPEKRPFDAAVVRASLEQVLEKVKAQQSAGVDAVTGGTMTGARSATRTLAQEDREAARTLAKSLGKGKKKRKARPLYKRAWVQGLGIALALAALGGLIVWALQPPSPEVLYAEAKQLMDRGDKDRARGPIDKYLKYYGKRKAGSDQLKQVQAWADEQDARQREDTLLNRMKINMTPDDGVESAARDAIRHEDAGEFNSALAAWQEVLKSETDGEPVHRELALVAKKRLRELKAADDRLLALQQKVDLIRAGEEQKQDSEAEKLAVEAMRYEKIGDAALAARRWSMLKLKSAGDGGDRTWFLVAARQANEQKAKAPKSSEEEKARRDELLEERLKDAEAKAKDGQKAEALRTAYEVQLLYDRPELEVKEQVKRAKQLIKELGGT
jgi:serine/threonine-protein kinase